MLTHTRAWSITCSEKPHTSMNVLSQHAHTHILKYQPFTVRKAKGELHSLTTSTVTPTMALCKKPIGSQAFFPCTMILFLSLTLTFSILFFISVTSANSKAIMWWCPINDALQTENIYGQFNHHPTTIFISTSVSWYLKINKALP